MKTRALCILGMHRSGTSCLAGLLEQVGVYLGAVSRQNPSNVKGNNENLRIMRLHDAILRDNGGSWDAPPAVVHWSAERSAELDTIISDYRGACLWGFKDPRSLFVLDGWLEKLPGLEPVGIFRHPLLVAESLRRRNGGDLSYWLSLWARYNRRLLEWHNRHAFPMLAFDAGFFPEGFSRVLTALGLPHPSVAPNFFVPDLRHLEPASDVRVPDEVKAIYRDIKALAL